MAALLHLQVQDAVCICAPAPSQALALEALGAEGRQYVDALIAPLKGEDRAVRGDNRSRHRGLARSHTSWAYCCASDACVPYLPHVAPSPSTLPNPTPHPAPFIVPHLTHPPRPALHPPTPPARLPSEPRPAACRPGPPGAARGGRRGRHLPVGAPAPRPRLRGRPRGGDVAGAAGGRVRHPGLCLRHARCAAGQGARPGERVYVPGPSGNIP